MREDWKTCFQSTVVDVVIKRQETRYGAESNFWPQAQKTDICISCF